MGKRKHPEHEIPTEAPESVDESGQAEPTAIESPAEQPSRGAADLPPEAVAEEQIPALESAVERLQTELDGLNDRYLRLAAEFDNFRKRTLRERSDVRERAQADFARQLLETLDDLARVTALEAGNVTVHDVIEGIHMVERKLMQELERTGFERVGVAGEAFDPNHHEAVATQPAAGEATPGTIGNVLQPGYRLGNVLLRPARVIVVVDGPDT